MTTAPLASMPSTTMTLGRFLDEGPTVPSGSRVFPEITASSTAPALRGFTDPDPDVDEEEEVKSSSPDNCSVTFREIDSLAKKSNDVSLKVVENRADIGGLPRSTWYSVVFTLTTEFTTPFTDPLCWSIGARSIAKDPLENSENSWCKNWDPGF